MHVDIFTIHHVSSMVGIGHLKCGQTSRRVRCGRALSPRERMAAALNLMRDGPALKPIFVLTQTKLGLVSRN